MTRKQRARLMELSYRASLTYLENKEIIEILESTSTRTEAEELRLSQAKELKKRWDEYDPDLFKPLQPREVVIDGKEYVDIPRQAFCQKCTCIYGSYECHQTRCIIRTKPERY